MIPFFKWMFTRILFLMCIMFTTYLGAQTIVYTAPLLGTNEVPVVMTPATGQVTVTIDIAAQTMQVQATFSNFMGTTTNAHIHCCVLPGNNASVASMVPTFAGFPSGVNAGSFDQTFDLTNAASFNPTFITNNGGSAATASAALLAGLAAGQAYFNIHTSSFSGGEARANLQLNVPAVTAIPTLSTWGLGILALLIVIVGVVTVLIPSRALV